MLGTISSIYYRITSVLESLVAPLRFETYGLATKERLRKDLGLKPSLATKDKYK
jgi:hypothetical protein